MFVCNRALLLAECQGEHQKHGDLSGECLGGGNADLRSYVYIRTGVCVSRYARTDSVAYSINECAVVFCQVHGSQRVGCLTALGDCYHDVGTVDDRISVSELAGVFHFHRYAAKRLYQLLADESGMP